MKAAVRQSQGPILGILYQLKEPTPMATTPNAPKAVAKKSVTGYKNHRAGSNAEKAHKMVDDNPAAKNDVLIARICKLGISEVTARHWVSVFRSNCKIEAPAPKETPTRKKQTPTKKKGQ